MKNGEQNDDTDLELDKAKISTIDKDNLDEEFEGQADRVFDYSQEQAEADFNVLELESELKVIQAESELDIRNKPKRYKLKVPIREAAVKLQIVLHPKVRRCVKRLNRAKFQAAQLKGALKALDHRKTCLENLNDLHKRGYFGKPSQTVRGEGNDFTKGTSPKKRRAHAD